MTSKSLRARMTRWSSRVALLAALTASTSTRIDAQAYDASNGGGTGLPPGAITSNVQMNFCSYYFTPMSPYTQCVYNDYGYSYSAVSSATPFTFQGGYFAASDTYSAAPTTLQFIGSDATTTYTASCPLTLNTFVFCSFAGATDYTNTSIIDITFVTSGGRDVYNTQDGGYYVANALEFNSGEVVASPEPSSAILVATGFFGVYGMMRRRRRATSSP